MNIRRVTCFLFLAAFMVFSPRPVVTAAEPQWSAGVAQTSITPDGAYWMGGYASRKKPSEGTDLDLRAKALALKDAEGNRLVIVTLDLLVVTPKMADTVLAGAKERYGLEPANVLLNCSHTHCGPELRLYRETLHNIPQPHMVKMRTYVDWLNARLIDLIGDALNELRPARLTTSQASADFAINRRNNRGAELDRRFAAGALEGPVDHAVPVLRVADSSGKALAIVFGYACHNTTMSFFKTSGDYAGYAQKFVEESHPGAVAMFVMGAGGDQNPHPRREQKHLAQHGKALADAVERALAGKQIDVQSRLRVAREDAPLEFQPHADRATLERQLKSKNPYERWKARYVLGQLNAGRKPIDSWDLPVQAAKFGDEILLVAIGGETVVDYSQRFKKEFANTGGAKSPSPMLWFAGYSTDVSFYLPSLRVLKEGGYEGGGHMVYTKFSGPFTEDVEERVFRAIRSAVKEVSE
ncbi:MAG: neutral ceramidase [Limisphaerales bacterium]|jgi:neutral ceramidase